VQSITEQLSERNGKQEAVKPPVDERSALIVQIVNERTSDKMLYGDKYEVNKRALLDLAYTNGFQYTYWDEKLGRVRDMPRVEDRSRVIDNKILPAVQHASNLLTQNIQFQLRPSSPDFRAKAEAKNGERALQHLYRTKRWKRKIRKMMRWCVTTGVGFIRPVFDPSAGPVMTVYLDPQTGDPIPEEYLTPQIVEILQREGFVKQQPLGDIDLETYSIFDVVLPSGASDVMDCSWYALTQRRSLSAIRTRYRDMGQFVAPEEIGGAEESLFEGRILAMGGGQSSRQYGRLPITSAYEPDTDSAIVRTVCELPSVDNPEGFCATVAGGVLLEVVPCPSYTFGLLGHDLHKFDFIDRPGSMWPISLPENMIPVQRELNSARSHRADLRRKGLVLRTFVPRGAQMAKSAILGGDFHTVVDYDASKGPVTHAPFPNIPSSLFAEIADSGQSLRDLSAQHEAMQGMNPAGVRSGYAINLLNEKDLNFYREILEGHAETFEVLWTNVHQMVKKTWTMPRYIQELSDAELVWSGFIGADDLAENAQVIVDIENLVPQSRAAKQAFASEMLQFAPNLLALPPLIRASILEALEIGDATEVQDIFKLDKRWAERSLQIIIGDPEKGMEGQDVAVRPGIDDHELQLQVVRNFQKTAAYDQLPPDAKMRIERYAKGHVLSIVQALVANQSFLGGGGGQAKPGQEGGKPAGPGKNNSQSDNSEE
jgi:hypothetical protein